MPASPGLPVTWRNAVATPTGWIAIALVIIELVAGMQTYVTQTIKPLMAADLDGRQLYGVVTAVGQVGTFVMMPIGGALLTRFRATTLLTWLMPVTAIGATLCAVAPGMPTFIAGTLVRALASGALATVGMGVIVTEMPKQWRQILLAALSGIWVVSSLVGPAYASLLSNIAGWRWAMVAYLPIFFAARGLIAWHLRSSPAEAGEKPSLKIPSALLLASGIALVATFTSVAWWRIALCAIGAVAVIVAVRALLPDGVATLRRGRPSAIAAMFVLCGVYFGGSSLTAIVAHDVLNFSALQIGVLLAAGGLGWAVVGFHCGRRPAPTDAVFASRMGRAIIGVTAGLSLMGVTAVLPGGTASGVVFVLGWLIAGIGMGFGYLDLMNRVFEHEQDGIGQAQAATAVVLAEAVAAALFSTLSTTSLVSIAQVQGGHAAGFIFVILAVLGLTLIPAVRRAVPRAVARPNQLDTGVSR